MAQLGVANEVACLDFATDDWEVVDTFPIHAVGKRRTSWSYQEKLLPWLRANLDRFDAVISHGLWQYHGVAVRRAALRENKPYFVFPHGMLDPWFQREPSRRLKATRNWCYWRMIEESVIRDAAGILFTCEEEMRLARDTFRPYRPRQEFVVGYGVPEPPKVTEQMDRALRGRCPALTCTEKYLLFLGRIHPKKGVDVLVKAYEIVHRKHSAAGLDTPPLVIAGPGRETTYGRRVQQIAHRLQTSTGKPSVHFPGMLTGDSKWGAFYGARAFVLPSHQENFGIAAVEALACGVPLFLSKKVNIWREILSSGAAAVAEDTVEGTMLLIEQALADQPNRPAASSESLPKLCFEKHFSLEIAALRLMSVFTNGSSSTA